MAEWTLKHLEDSRGVFAVPVTGGWDPLPPYLAGRRCLAQEALGVTLDGSAVTALVRKWGSSLAGIKIEGGMMPERLSDLVGRGVELLTGWGGRDLATCLTTGAIGAIPVSSLARPWVAVYRRVRSGDVEGAYRVYEGLLPLVHFMMSGYERLVASDKSLLVARGVIATARSRIPGALLDRREEAELRRLAERLGLIH